MRVPSRTRSRARTHTGLDSSLVASLVVQMCDKMGKPRPATFSIGLQNSPDLKNARKVSSTPLLSLLDLASTQNSPDIKNARKVSPWGLGFRI